MGSRLEKARNANTILSDLLDFHISVYGLDFRYYKALPEVNIKGTHKDLNILNKDHYTTTTLNCCQCLGYSTIRFAWSNEVTKKLQFQYCTSASGNQEIVKYLVNYEIIEKSIIDKIIKETNLELFKEVYNSGGLTKEVNSNPNVFLTTIWEMNFVEMETTTIPQDKQEFIKILQFWEEKFGKDFHFHYTWDPKTLSNFKMCFSSDDLLTGQKRIATIELGRIPFCSDNICSSFMYFLETKYIINFPEPLMGYWFSTMFLHQSGITQQYHSIFGYNTNSLYYGYATNYVPLEKALLKLSNSCVQQSFVGERNGDQQHLEVGACKNIDLWMLSTSPSRFHIVTISYLRKHNMIEWFLDDEMEIYTAKHFWNCMLDTLLINQDKFIELVKII